MVDNLWASDICLQKSHFQVSCISCPVWPCQWCLLLEPPPTPVTREAVRLLRSDWLRPDGLTLVPLQSGKSLYWDIKATFPLTEQGLLWHRNAHLATMCFQLLVHEYGMHCHQTSPVCSLSRPSVATETHLFRRNTILNLYCFVVQKCQTRTLTWR